jgi:hypothetical protein
MMFSNGNKYPTLAPVKPTDMSEAQRKEFEEDPDRQ